MARVPYKEYSVLPVPSTSKVLELRNVDIKKKVFECRTLVDEHSDEWAKKSIEQKINQYDPELGGEYWNNLWLESLTDLLYYYEEENYTIRDYTGLFPDFITNNIIYYYDDPNTNDEIVVTDINDKFSFIVVGVKNSTNFGVYNKDICTLEFLSIDKFNELMGNSLIREDDWNFIVKKAYERNNGFIPAFNYFGDWYALAMFNPG